MKLNNKQKENSNKPLNISQLIWGLVATISCLVIATLLDKEE